MLCDQEPLIVWQDPVALREDILLSTLSGEVVHMGLRAKKTPVGCSTTFLLGDQAPRTSITALFQSPLLSKGDNTLCDYVNLQFS